jgi:putative membrane protein
VNHAGGFEAQVLVTTLACSYEWLATRAIATGRPWSRWRTASFLAGCLLLVLALASDGRGSFVAHTVQHLIIGMYAPLALVLGAPVSLLLRSLPVRAARAVGRLLHTRVVEVVAHPVTALGLSVGVLVLLYATPLYTWSVDHPAVHDVLLLHFLVSGCLFAWVIAGPDPAPRRPSVPARLVVLGIAIAAHSVLAQLLFAGVVDVAATTAQRQAAATLMYYGGDVAELLLALALVSSWRPRRAPRASRLPT